VRVIGRAVLSCQGFVGVAVQLAEPVVGSEPGTTATGPQRTVEPSLNVTVALPAFPREPSSRSVTLARSVAVADEPPAGASARMSPV